jgi:hypothetical protein
MQQQRVLRARLDEERQLARQLARMQAERDPEVIYLPQETREAQIRHLETLADIERNRQDDIMDTILARAERAQRGIQELRNRITTMQQEREEEARQRMIEEEQERQIAVVLELQARQRNAVRMMEEAERLRDGWTGCSVM